MLRCEASGADFGERVSFESDVMGCALFTEPRNACHNVSIPPISLNSTRYMCDDKFIAIVPRGECTFSEKAYYCQNAPPPGYSALIVYDERGRSPSPMAGGKYAELVNIPVVMISYACMEDIMNNYSADKGFLVMIKGAPGYYDLVKYLIPFIAVVGFCFLILLIALVVRLCREHREVARSRLSRSGLRKIPTRKFVKGEEPETCPICLDDFVEGEKLRILPCRHAYHCKCVDPWLTKNRKVCPVCKRKVGAHDDSSDSDAERNANSAASRERDPLLRS
uniref:RING-type domain-containing protein n=1 Tax=Plectus sambesii TaxID=2011161 RepID=A0A914UQ18_9BILA